MKRPRAWALAFAGYAYVVTVAVSALFLVRAREARGLPASYAEALIWQGTGYALWAPVAWFCWIVFRRLGVRPAGVMAFLLLGWLVVPLHALATAAVDASFSPYATLADLPQLLEERLPVGILIYSALGAVGAALQLRRRADEHARRAEALEAALELARERLSARVEERKADADTPSERLMVSMGSKRAPVDPGEVEWFGSAGNYVVVNWNGREGLIRDTLQALEQRLDPAVFARSHRSTIINLARVRETASLSDGSWRVVMQSGAELVASRTYRDEILRRLGRG
jgi:hypothetical protein